MTMHSPKPLELQESHLCTRCNTELRNESVFELCKCQVQKLPENWEQTVRLIALKLGVKRGKRTK